MAMYGSRSLKIAEEQGTWYMPFDGGVCRDLLLSIRAEVGSGDIYTDSRTMEVLDNLYAHGIINGKQYNLEVLFDWATMTVLHFKYWR